MRDAEREKKSLSNVEGTCAETPSNERPGKLRIESATAQMKVVTLTSSRKITHCTETLLLLHRFEGVKAQLLSKPRRTRQEEET